MFRDRAFNLSILFSTGWHLFWICVIGIVITPSVQPSNFYQEVDFLGPILEKTAFDLMVEEVKPQSETLYAQSTRFLDNVYLKPKGPERKVLKEFVPDTLLERFTFSLQHYMKDTKEVPLYFAEDIRMVYAKVDKERKSPFMEGPAQEREIIFKPPPPTILRGLYGNRQEYVVKLKFVISSGGLVHGVEPVVSSGYPGVDLQAIKFLKKWRFLPSSLVKKDESIWGIVTIKVEAK